MWLNLITVVRSSYFLNDTATKLQPPPSTQEACVVEYHSAESQNDTRQFHLFTVSPLSFPLVWQPCHDHTHHLLLPG